MIDIPSKLIQLAAAAETASRYLSGATAALAGSVGADYIALVRGQKGTWRTLAESGLERPLPEELLADVLDGDRLVVAGQWLAAPIAPKTQRGELVVLHLPHAIDDGRHQQFAQLLQPFQQALEEVRLRERQAHRIRRLEAVLEIAGQWNQTHEMEPLLVKMAEASTRLLGAERASIFLWDRQSKTLVGRPALGVEGGELRIADDTGIVGQVVHSGEPRRVDTDIEREQREIDRRVDKQLGFQTQSLLCVPLRGSKGELFGAFEVINKIGGNFTDEDEAALTELAGHAAIALENTQQYEQLLKSRNQMAERAAEGVELIGDCPAVQALRSTIRRVAPTDLSVLVLGENGTGKEVVSQMVHFLSDRRNEPFVAVNCAALTETLLESELFGHEKGAFTDAHEARAGKFELASGGTLFLDEIGDMSLGGQAKLLRVLEEKIVVRVGGSKPITTDVRVFAATNQDLGELVRAKKFREDLFFRLNVVTLEMPPLRDRGDDVLLLAEHFLNRFCIAAGRRPPKFTAAARKRLVGHSWPGNVRELRNLMERLAYLSQGEKVDAEDLAFILSPKPEGAGVFTLDHTLADATKQFQGEYINRHIERARGNMTEAARRLGLHRSNLYRKMRQLGMHVEET
ncbi:MAG: sigma-54-dependent Fis family transcriptional regulator [Pirellulaceae bacterium]